MGLFNSLCKQCDNEIDWFLEAKGGIKCHNCGTLNTEKDLQQNFCGLDYHRGDKQLYIKKRRAIRERKLKIEQIKKSM